MLKAPAPHARAYRRPQRAAQTLRILPKTPGSHPDARDPSQGASEPPRRLGFFPRSRGAAQTLRILPQAPGSRPHAPDSSRSAGELPKRSRSFPTRFLAVQRLGFVPRRFLSLPRRSGNDPTASRGNPGAADGFRRPWIGSKAFGNDPDASGCQLFGLGSSIFRRERSRGAGQASERFGLASSSGPMLPFCIGSFLFRLGSSASVRAPTFPTGRLAAPAGSSLRAKKRPPLRPWDRAASDGARELVASPRRRSATSAVMTH